MSFSRPRLVLLAVAAVVVLLLVALVAWLRPPATGVAAAVDVLPDDTLRVGYVDWSQVVELADGGEVDEGSEDSVRAFFGRVYEQDLTVGSALDTSLTALDANLGVSPLDATWEVYGQARQSSVSVLALGDEVDLEAVEGRLGDLGYQAPSEGAGEGGTWVGTPEVVAGMDPPLTPVQENLAVLADERLLVMSDAPEAVSRAVAVIRGDEESLGSVDGVDDLVSVAEDAPTVALWVDDYACEELAMSQADPSDIDAAEGLVGEVGGVHPLAGLVMAQRPDGSLGVGMRFASSDQASADLQPRVDLAGGRGGRAGRVVRGPLLRLRGVRRRRPGRDGPDPRRRPLPRRPRPGPPALRHLLTHPPWPPPAVTALRAAVRTRTDSQGSNGGLWRGIRHARRPAGGCGHAALPIPHHLAASATGRAGAGGPLGPDGADHGAGPGSPVAEDLAGALRPGRRRPCRARAAHRRGGRSPLARWCGDRLGRPTVVRRLDVRRPRLGRTDAEGRAAGHGSAPGTSGATWDPSAL